MQCLRKGCKQLRITNCCVEEAVIIIVIFVSVKCEQWHKVSANNKEFNLNRTHLFLLGWQLTNSYINVFKR